jgi:fatty-acyl-CoA synthase
MMGAVLMTVNWRLSADQLIYTLNHAEVKAVLINSDFVPIWQAIRPRVESVEKVVVLYETDEAKALETGADIDYETMLAGAEPSYPFADIDENTRATLFYTTGTTGDPKGVHFSHRQLVLHTLAATVACGSCSELRGFRTNDVYMPLTPLFHVHAWGVPYIASLLGTKQVYPGRYEPEFLVKLIERENVTFSHCVPTILQMILHTPAAKDADLSKWNVNIGGSALPKGLARAARERGIEVVSSYGMSETCPMISVARPKPSMMPLEGEPYLDIITKTGLPAPMVEIEVVDPHGKILPHDGVSTGEVIFRAPWLTPSYYKSPEKTAELWRDGWMHSGDVGYIDSQGYLTITDRIKDVIKTGGEWISSLDLENVMSQHEAVMEAAAVGVPDTKWGERPLVLVVLKSDQKDMVDENALMEHMATMSERGLLPKYGVPDRCIIVDEIPKTSVGKIDKKLIRHNYS